MFVRPEKEVVESGERGVQQFKADLDKCSTKEIYERYIKGKVSGVLLDDGVYKLTEMFKERWGYCKYHLVGSGKLGFSIKPTRRWGLFDFNKSDFDVAVISPEVFAEFWSRAHGSGYWRTRGEFMRCVADGWIRPDYLPDHLSQEWFDFFRSFQSDRIFGAFKVRAALYPNEYFLERYQFVAIEECRGK
jgi:hypothetical protein